MMNRYQALGVLLLGVAGAASAQQTSARSEARALIVTASNTTANQLLVYSPAGKLLKTIVTGGQGGVSGNAGGIAQDHRRLAVVNFGSGTVSVFVKDLAHANLQLESVIQAVASPVSLAFGDDHLYILSTTSVESHPIDSNGTIGVAASPDGVAGLLHADGSAAQVGKLRGQLIISEKSNAIETVNLNGAGAVTGSATLVSNIPANVNAPFGLVTRGNDAYVTIAHANEISLVRHDQVRARDEFRNSVGAVLGGARWSVLVLGQLAEPERVTLPGLRGCDHSAGAGRRELQWQSDGYHLSLGPGGGGRWEFDGGRIAPVDVPRRRAWQAGALRRRHDHWRCNERRCDRERGRRRPLLKPGRYG